MSEPGFTKDEIVIYSRVKTTREAEYTRYLDQMMVKVHAHQNGDDPPLYFIYLKRKDGDNSAPPALTAAEVPNVLTTIAYMVQTFEDEVT